MNLHDTQLPPLRWQPGFYVHASNIHTGEAQKYGPFPGSPMFTYEFLRCSGEENIPNDDHIFSFSDGRNRIQNPGRDYWTDQDSEYRDDGWRRCYWRPDGIATWGQFGIEHGPYWTDLFIETDLFPSGQQWESNRLPQE